MCQSSMMEKTETEEDGQKQIFKIFPFRLCRARRLHATHKYQLIEITSFPRLHATSLSCNLTTQVNRVCMTLLINQVVCVMSFSFIMWVGAAFWVDWATSTSAARNERTFDHFLGHETVWQAVLAFIHFQDMNNLIADVCSCIFTSEISP